MRVSMIVVVFFCVRTRRLRRISPPPPPLSQLAFGPASTYEGWAADVDLTVQETCCFSWQGTSILNSHLDLLLISPRPIAQRREAYIYNSKNERFFPASISQLHVNVGASKEALRTATASGQCARPRPAPGILSDRKYRYHPRTQADVADCWPWRNRGGSKLGVNLFCGKS